MLRSLPILTILLCVPLSASSVFAAQKARIEIRSSWTGLGAPTQSDVVIVGQQGKYQSNGRSVDSRSVAALLEVLEQPAIGIPDLANCGISEQWLASNSAPALKDYTHRKASELSPQGIHLFHTKFEDIPFAQAAFSELFKFGHTDDFPQMSVSVTVDGRDFGVMSESQYPFMLPWSGMDKARGGYNCHISQAIAALLPSKFTNKDRLLPTESFRWELTSRVMYEIEPEWNMLDTDYKVGADVKPVFARLSPITSALKCLSSVDVDGCSWNATLRDPDLPSNVVIGVSLPYYNEHRPIHLIGAAEFLKRIPDYANLVRSVPWFAKYVEEHPEVKIEIRYVGDRSLSSKALSSLMKDMAQHGKPALANRVSREARESVFLEVDCGSGCFSRVVVFPDRDILLWHFRGDSVVGFSGNDFSFWDYYGWRSIGALVGPDGRVKNNAANGSAE